MREKTTPTSMDRAEIVNWARIAYAEGAQDEVVPPFEATAAFRDLTAALEAFGPDDVWESIYDHIDHDRLTEARAELTAALEKWQRSPSGAYATAFLGFLDGGDS